MRHRKRRFRLNRFSSWRRATLIGLSKDVLIHQSIKTTKIKAKATQPLLERLITLGRTNSLAARRKAFSILQDHSLVKLLFSEIAPRYSNRNGGYTRILPFGFRRGDWASIAILELTEKKKVEKKAVKKQEAEPKPQEELPKPAAKPPVKPSLTKKPTRRFLGGIKKIFKKERDSL